MSVLCVIPARGGSKGIPRKNVIDVGGKPLLAWTIEQALTVPGLDVRVSTEDDEIADVARTYGATVIARPAELALDVTATEPVVRHAIDMVTTERGRPDAVMLLQPTSPIRRPDTLRRALTEFDHNGVDSMVGVVAQAPFLWRATDPPTAAYDITHRPRRQDLTPQSLRYRETGSLYVTRTDIYERLDNRLGGKVGLFVMSEEEGIDIDGFEDLELARKRIGMAGSP